jgi:SOS-response transcriptional repressor LexA
MNAAPVIPIEGPRVIRIADGADCGAAEPFALLVLGDSMVPEFREGEVIVVEPEGLATEGAFVVAQVAGEWMLRRLASETGAWRLVALNPAYPSVGIPDLTAVRGVVIQKGWPGRRRSVKRYVD